MELSNNIEGVEASNPLKNVQELLHSQANKYQKKIAEYKAQEVEYKDQIKILEEQLKLALIRKYGRSTEKYVDPNNPQQDLFGDESIKDAEDLLKESTDEDEGEKDKITVPEHTRETKSRGKRENLPDCLERVRVEYKIPDEDLIAPNGDTYMKIGEEISEQLDIIPADVRVIQRVRFKYALKNQEELGVKIADNPLLPIPKSIASAGLLAHMAEAKFRHHLPLYRQEKIWTDLGVHIPRNSMQRWMNTI